MHAALWDRDWSGFGQGVGDAGREGGSNATSRKSCL